ncbi:MAG: response regulator [Chloroflexi bacterium]|nr:response regulator [Chloroflexota bacterium]
MKILIADDESIIRLGLKSMLERMGHEVTAVGNGREALQMFRHHTFDLAVLDIKMPFTDGLQAAKNHRPYQPPRPSSCSLRLATRTSSKRRLTYRFRHI